MEIKVLEPQDIDKVLEFEEQRALRQFDDPVELEFHKWHSPWRRESLEHYISGGWSFVVRSLVARPLVAGTSAGEDFKIQGYFLAQPLLFLDGQTQSLWVEHMAYDSGEVGHQLVDIAYRYSREKHFQQVLFANSDEHKEALQGFNVQTWKGDVRCIKTTKGSTL